VSGINTGEKTTRRRQMCPSESFMKKTYTRLIVSTTKYRHMTASRPQIHNVLLPFSDVVVEVGNRLEWNPNSYFQDFDSDCTQILTQTFRIPIFGFLNSDSSVVCHLEKTATDYFCKLIVTDFLQVNRHCLISEAAA